MQIIDYESYENCHFEHLELDEAVLQEVSFYRCSFASSSFQYAQFIDCEFQECSFNGCNLSLVLLANSKIIDTEFCNSKLLGINWGNLGPVILARFSNCLMDRSSFSGQNLTKVYFGSCSLRDASFADSNLACVKFDDCDFLGCQFHHTNLACSDFSSSRNYFINAETNEIKKAKFSLPEVLSLLANLEIELK
ncbi:pentapeptide repeat-containing protein [Maridesulfovibrio sp.]|uniref:pentapeptide repeat-containing protein n=1 Tax=Maridesulfovibrio sp. TaxID=2795000 RepID=UPI0029F4F178|nr:pentapeptide repeat-containing protein [Maridesulfovibrio sp.]